VRAKGLIIATGLLAVLGGLIWWSNRHQKGDEPAGPAGAKKLLTLTMNDVVKVELRREVETTRLEQVQPGTYKLTSPEALATDRDQVNGLISALAALTADKVVDEKPADLAGFGLAKPALTIVASMRNGASHTVKLGDDAPVGGGVFAQVDGDARVYLLNAQVKGAIDKLGADLRDKHIVKFVPEQLTRIELAGPAATLEFTRGAQSEWIISKPRPLRADSFAVEELLRQMKEAQLDPLLTSDQKQELAKQFKTAQPLETVTVAGQAGAEKLEVRKTKDARYYAQSSSADGFHMLTPDIGKAFERKADDYRNKKLFDFGFSDPGKVEYKDAKAHRAFSKSGEKWLENLKPVDAAAVQTMIDKLRDLAAVKFPESGFPKAEIELTVVSQNGKLSEHVEIAKTSTGYVARRTGEPALYELDGSAVDDVVKAVSGIKEAATKK